MTVFKHTWHHIRRSPFQSLTALVVMSFTFLILSTFVIINSGLSRVLNYFETKPEITLFLKDGLSQITIDNLQKELSSYSNIKEIKYISKEKALEIYKQENKDNPMLTEMVTASILPASFEVTVSDPKILEQINQTYASRGDLIDEVIYQRDVIKSLLNWTNIIRRSGIIITLAVTLISFLTTFTVIGMKLTNRKEEIRISRLLGASNFYVKKPFLIEGMIYGAAGAIVGFFISLILALILKTSVNSFFKPVVFIDTSIIFYSLSLLGEIFLGCLIGFVASWIGAKRYIKF